NIVVRIDPVACLTVPPIVNGDAAADVRLDGRTVAKRQEPEGCGERDDSQLQLLSDFCPVAIHAACVHAERTLLVVTQAQTGFEVRAETDEPIATKRESVKVSHVEAQETGVVEQHVV